MSKKQAYTDSSDYKYLTKPDAPFVVLGSADMAIYFYKKDTRETIRVSASNIRKVDVLVMLAPELWWSQQWENTGKGPLNFCTAGVRDALYALASYRGVYDETAIRRGGAWMDGDTLSFMLGGYVWRNGAVLPVADAMAETGHVYDPGRRAASSPLASLPAPMTKRGVVELVGLCEGVGWTRPEIDGRLLAGWLACAPLCGVMPFTPHIMISAQFGTGKTWVVKDFICKLLGGVFAYYDGLSSCAGIRDDIASKFIPVIIDEFEADRAGNGAVDEVLSLARAATGSGGAVVQRSDGKSGRRYIVKSAFLFAATANPMTLDADRSRTIVMDRGAFDFEAVSARVAQVATPEWSAGFLALILDRARVILASYDPFRAALAEYLREVGHTSSGRAAQTYAAPLAGLWGLVNTTAPTPEQAAESVREREWVVAAASGGDGGADQSPDWRRAIDHLMQTTLDLAGARKERRSIGGMVDSLRNGDCGEGRDELAEAALRKTFDDTLQAAGLRLDDGCLCVANTSREVARAFAHHQQFSRDWRGVLRRAPGATAGGQMRFRGGVGSAKCLKVPLVVVRPDGADAA